MTYRKGCLAFLILLSGLLSGLLTCPARADEPPPLDIGPPLYDEIRSTGREIAPPKLRPSDAEAPVLACSFTESVCVHAPANAPPASVLATLEHAERALSTYRALGLPGPLSDGELGGSPAFDLYLLPSVAEPLTTIDPIARYASFDTESSFALLPLASDSSCHTGAAVARAIAHAICLRFDAGIEDGAAAMASSYLAMLASSCDLEELEAVDTFQRAPHRSLMRASPSTASGSLLLPWFLDDRYGLGAPSRVIMSLFAVASQRTPADSWAWNNEPDLFDALRANMKARKLGLDDMLLDFAIDRAFVGDRSDGMHLEGTERFGAFGRVSFEWSIPYATLPRRLAPAHPIEPTGATYLWLDLGDAPPAGDLTVVFDWELPALFRWALIKVDPRGVEVGRVDVGGVYGAQHAERTIARLDGLAGVLVVGINAGSIDRAHPYDPDEEPLMPHSYTVTFVR